MSSKAGNSRLQQSRMVHHAEPMVDISSLIDVSFLLLIYFLVTTTLMKKEVDVDFRLPGPGIGPVSELSPMHVTVKASGDVIVGAAQRGENLGPVLASGSHPALLERLADYKNAANRAASGAVVRLTVDDASSHQQFSQILNILQIVGIDDLMIDYQQEQP